MYRIMKCFFVFMEGYSVNFNMSYFQQVLDFYNNNVRF